MFRSIHQLDYLSISAYLQLQEKGSKLFFTVVTDWY